MRKLFLALFAMAALAVNAKVEVVNLAAGGDLESANTCVAVKSNEGGNSAITFADPVAGIGKDGSKGISVLSVANAAEGAQDWDAQLWLVLSEALPAGTSVSVKFDYKASSEVSVGTQSHGEPGAYQHWAAIGDVAFGTEWKTFTSTFEVSADMAGSNGGLKSIAFNLAKDRENDVTFYIDNVVITYEKEIIEEGAPVIKTLTGVNILGTNIKKENDGQFVECPADQIAVITGHKVEQTWDVQYWIGLSSALSNNTPFNVSFDYKASADATVDTQTHAAPGAYLHWACIGNVNFTTDWQTFSYSGKAQKDNMQSIAFNLAQSTDDVTYEFKNVAVTADVTINPGNASTSVANNATISRMGWNGLTVSYPNSNAAILSSLGIKAALTAKKAYLYEDGVEAPVASEVLTGDLDKVVLFAGATLKAGTKYNVVIPEIGLQLLADNGDCYWYNKKEIALSFTTKAVLDDKPTIAYSEAATDGTAQYLYNVETGTFLYKGNDWGTRSTASTSEALLIALEAKGETYRLLNKTGNNAFDCDGGNSVWIDGQNRTGDGNWTITSNNDGTYTLANTNAGEQKWGVKKDLSDTRFYFNTDDETYANIWAFISVADYDAYKVNAAEYLAALAQKNLDDANKAALAAKKALIDGTNVYDKAGYDAYVAKYNEELAAVEAGGYSGTVTNPSATTGWHASTDYNFLLTPWKIADVDCNNYDAGLYMNTWSVEGVTDGSNFLVPFFEYWTGDNNSLGATELSTVVTGLKPNKNHIVSALARVRLNNGSKDDQATGINFVAGNGEGVDACLGEAYGQMRMMKVTTTGKSDSEGNLKVAFVVNEGNNISWLSYKDVMVEPVPTPDDGEYYIQNVESGLFFAGANNWGTRLSVANQGDLFNITEQDGKYELVDRDLSSNAKALGTNLYTDNGGFNWTIEAVTGEKGVYTIKNDAGYIAQSAEAGKHIGYVAEQIADVKGASKWYFLTKEEAVAKLAAATEKAPVDASFLLGNANFSRNHNQSAWTVDAGNKNLAGGSNDNMCGESWRSAFNIRQTINVPNGVYELNAQAALTDYTNAYDGNTYPVVYANEESSVFNEMIASDRGTSMGQLSNSFTNGLYSVSPVFVQVTDGTLTVGIKGTRTDTWCIWDNFQVKYYGADANLNNVKFAQYRDALAQLKAEAETVEGKMGNVEASDLAEAKTVEPEETVEAYTAAIAKLTSAITAAKKSVKTYANSKIAIAQAVANAKAAGVDISKEVEAYEAAYNAGTLAEETTAVDAALKAAIKTLVVEDATQIEGVIVNPSFETGDMTGWTATGLHAATNKNFGMLTGNIFVENWTPGPGTLANETMSQAITLNAGRYVLTCEAQFLQQGDANVVPGGFFLFAGDAKAEISNNAGTFAVYFDVTEKSSVEIGAKIESATGNWASIDNFQLYQLPDLVYATPGEGELTEISKIEFTYGFGKTISPTLSPNANITVTNANAEVVATITQRDLLKALEENCLSEENTINKINVVLAEAITTPGAYTINIPAKAFYLGHSVIMNEAVSFTYNISGSVKGETDAINAIAGNAKDGKFMKNGKVVIVRNGKTYNVAGQIVK